MSGEHIYASEVFPRNFDLEKALAITAEKGYFFAEEGICKQANDDLLIEISSLELEVEDRTNNPLNQGETNEVKQKHEKAYFVFSDPKTPAANNVIRLISRSVSELKTFPELGTLQLNEIGYQKYFRNGYFISAHRDRKSDQLLGITFNIIGSTVIKIHKTLGAADDYLNLEQIDEFTTASQSSMFLRDPGFGSGERIIHEVCPPLSESRSVLNLRMRPTH
jgi:hypothetical protein